MQNEHGAGIVPAPARAELVHHHAASAEHQPMVPRPLHELRSAVDSSPFAIGKTPRIGGPAEQFERRLAANARRDALGGAEQPTDDLDAD